MSYRLKLCRYRITICFHAFKYIWWHNEKLLRYFIYIISYNGYYLQIANCLITINTIFSNIIIAYIIYNRHWTKVTVCSPPNKRCINHCSITMDYAGIYCNQISLLLLLSTFAFSLQFKIWLASYDSDLLFLSYNFQFILLISNFQLSISTFWFLTSDFWIPVLYFWLPGSEFWFLASIFFNSDFQLSIFPN